MNESNSLKYFSPSQTWPEFSERIDHRLDMKKSLLVVKGFSDDLYSEECLQSPVVENIEKSIDCLVDYSCYSVIVICQLINTGDISEAWERIKILVCERFTRARPEVSMDQIQAVNAREEAIESLMLNLVHSVIMYARLMSSIIDLEHRDEDRINTNKEYTVKAEY